MPPKIVMSKIGESPESENKKKNTKHSLDFQDELDKKIAEHQREVTKIKHQIEVIKRSNERIQRKQERTFGATIDNVKIMKRDWETTLASNDRLYHEMEGTREHFDRLKNDLTLTRKKVATASSDISEFKRQSKGWKETDESYIKCEESSKDLIELNKALRYKLLKNHIDPNAKRSPEIETNPVKSILKTNTETSDINKNSKLKYSKLTKPRQRTLSWGKTSSSDVFENIRRRIQVTDADYNRRATQSYESYYDRYKQMRARTVNLPRLQHTAAMSM